MSKRHVKQQIKIKFHGKRQIKKNKKIENNRKLDAKNKIFQQNILEMDVCVRAYVKL